MVQGLANVLRPAARAGLTDPEALERGPTSAEEVPRLQGPSAELVRALLACPLVLRETTGQIPVLPLDRLEVLPHRPLGAVGR